MTAKIFHGTTALAAFVLALMLTSCASATPTSHPTAIPTMLAFTFTLQPTPIISKTPTPFIKLPTPTSYPSLQSLGTDMAKFPSPCDDVNFEQISPNGKWQLLTCDYDDNTRKMVVENQTGTKWEFKYEDFFHPDANDPGIAVSSSLSPIHWSLDGHYLYFTSYAGFEGGGTCFYGFGAQGLFRLDLQSGNFSTILAALPYSNDNGYEIAFSPTGRRFAYSRIYWKGKNHFHLVDIATGQETIFPTEQQNGTFTWSPDGASLAYSTSLCNFDPAKIIHSYIKVLNIADFSTRTIAQSDTNFLTISDWSTTGFLNIKSLSLTTAEEEVISLNPQQSIVIPLGTAAP